MDEKRHCNPLRQAVYTSVRRPLKAGDRPVGSIVTYRTLVAGSAEIGRALRARSGSPVFGIGS